MKFKLLLILVLGTQVLFSQSDDHQGKLSVGISGLPLYFNSAENAIAFSGFATKGSLGYFVSNRFSLENNIFYYKNDNVFPNGNRKVQSQSYGFQLSLRFHVPLGKVVRLYADAGAGFGGVSYSDDYTSFDYDIFNSGTFLYTVGIGSFVRIYKKLDFEIFIPWLGVYNTTNNLNIYGEGRGRLLYGGMAGPNIGLRYTF